MSKYKRSFLTIKVVRDLRFLFFFKKLYTNNVPSDTILKDTKNNTDENYNFTKYNIRGTFKNVNVERGK